MASNTSTKQSDLADSRYKQFFLNNRAGLYSISIDGKIHDCNMAFATTLGYASPKELIGTNAVDLYFEPKHRADFLNKILPLRELNNHEILLKGKEGQMVICLENSFLSEEENGETNINGAIAQITNERLLAEKYSWLFKFSEDGILFFENGRLVDTNIRISDMVEFTKEELLSFSDTQLINYLAKDNPESLELLAMKIEKARQGQNQQIKLKIRRKDGSLFHAKLGFYPFFAVGKRHTLVVVSDISERVLFEQTIKESETRFRTLSKVAIEGIVFVQNGIVVDCNEQIVLLLGFESNKDLIGKNLDDFILHPDMRRLRNTLLTSKTSRAEIRAINVKGSIIHLEGSGTEITLNNQKTEAYLLYDITGRKRAETELERSREQFKSLVENSPNGVWIIVENKIKYVNASGLKTLGYDEEDEVFEELFINLASSEARNGMEEDFKCIRAGKGVEAKEIQMLHKSGEKVPVSMNMTLSIYEHEPAIQVTLNNLALERQLIEEKLRAEMAEEVNEELKEEIRNHQETQQKLMAAQRFSRNIIDSSIDMIIAVDTEKQITEFNPAALKSFGFEEKEAIGAFADKLFAEPKEFKRVLLSLQKTGAFRGEITNRRKDGTCFTALLSASLIKNQQGEVIGSMGVSRDITDLKEARQRIEESEERLRDIFNNASDFILSVDYDGYVQYANKAFTETMGYSMEALSETRLNKMVEDRRLAEGANPIGLFNEETVKTTLITTKGERIRVAGNTGVRYEGTQPVGIRAILRNMTKETEQTAKLNSVFESTENLHMWTLDRDYRLTGSNKNFLHVLKTGFGQEMVPGDNYLGRIQNTINPDLYQNQLTAFGKAFDGLAQSFELPLLDILGENRWYQVFLNPVYIEDELQEISCIAYDITDRKVIDRKIRDALKEKEVLLKEVHHRVKNNLQVISSILSLQTGYVTDEKTLDVLRESQNRIKSMSYIHETLYQTADFSSIEFPEYINVIAKNLIHSYTIGGKLVRLETDFDHVSLSLDQAIPCGLIANELISNALKHAFKDTTSPALSIAVKQTGEKVALTVRDNGCGLPENFDYRNYNSLGVQLVYTLAEQLDAEVEVKSDKGTSFCITFEQITQ